MEPISTVLYPSNACQCLRDVMGITIVRWKKMNRIVVCFEVLESSENNFRWFLALCTAGEFACKVSEQCISLDRRCNGLIECDDGTDERDCDGKYF